MNLDFDEIKSAVMKSRWPRIVCPFCSAGRKKANQAKAVFRVWLQPDFLTYACAHCEQHGYLHAKNSTPIPIEKIAEMRRESERKAKEHRQERLSKARWLWRISGPIEGTVAERYLRNRAITVPLPPTLRSLPARDEYPPAMIAAFGFPREPERGRLEIADDGVVAVQLTYLKPDGSKADTEPQKRCIGSAEGVPIVLAPPNDALALAIAEGVETALSHHQLYGVGAWASTGDKKLADLAPAVPDYIEAVHIIADDDAGGLVGAKALVATLAGHGCETCVFLSPSRRAAA